MYIDALNLLSHKQTLTGSCYSRNCYDFLQQIDPAITTYPIYVNVVSHGTFDVNTTLEVQLVIATKPDFSDAKVVATSGEIQQADIVRGSHWSLQLSVQNTRYRYLAVKYVAGAETDADQATPDEPSYCPADPVLDKNEIKNTFTAVISTDNLSRIDYADLYR